MAAVHVGPSKTARYAAARRGGMRGSAVVYPTARGEGGPAVGMRGTWCRTNASGAAADVAGIALSLPRRRAALGSQRGFAAQHTGRGGTRLRSAQRTLAQRHATEVRRDGLDGSCGDAAVRPRRGARRSEGSDEVGQRQRVRWRWLGAGDLANDPANS